MVLWLLAALESVKVEHDFVFQTFNYSPFYLTAVNESDDSDIEEDSGKPKKIRVSQVSLDGGGIPSVCCSHSL